MKAVCFQSVESVACKEIDDPQVLHPQDAIVKVSLAGLCGSDLHVFFGRESGVDTDMVMGHELVGTVVAVGDEVSSVSVGDRVFTPFTTNCGDCFYCNMGMTCRCPQGQLFGWVENGTGLNGGQSEFVRVPLANGTLKRVPENVTDESALLLGDNLSTGYYCAEMAEIKAGAVYVVVGCGTVGLLCIMSAKQLGAETIIAVDPVDARRREAEQLGAIAMAPDDAALREIRTRTNGRGADGVMELVGLPAAQRFAFEAIRPCGIMSVVGCHCEPNFSFSPIDAFDKNLTYKSGRCPARHYMDRLTDLVADGTFQIDSFISRHFAPEECVAAYDVFSNRRDGCLKAAITF